MKSDRKKLRDAIIKYDHIKIEPWTYSGYYKHPKTGKRVTWSEACFYKNEQLEKLLDKFFPNDTRTT